MKKKIIPAVMLFVPVSAYAITETGAILSIGAAITAAVGVGSAAIVGAIEESSTLIYEQLLDMETKLSVDINALGGIIQQLMTAQTNEMIALAAQTESAQAQDHVQQTYGPLALGPGYCLDADTRMGSPAAAVKAVEAKAAAAADLNQYTIEGIERPTLATANILDLPEIALDINALLPPDKPTLSSDDIDNALLYTKLITEPRPTPKPDGVAADSVAGKEYEALSREKLARLSAARDSITSIIAQQTPTMDVPDGFEDQWKTHSDGDAPIVDGKISRLAWLENEVLYRSDSLEFKTAMQQQEMSGLMKEVIQSMAISNRLALLRMKSDNRQAVLQAVAAGSAVEDEYRVKFNSLRIFNQGGS